MSIFDFTCSKCGETKEYFRSAYDNPPEKCIACGSTDAEFNKDVTIPNGGYYVLSMSSSDHNHKDKIETNQTKLESLIETVVNISSGFVIAMITWEVIVKPYLGISTDLSENFTITLIFTSISIIRGYFWRRFFNKGIHKKIHKVLSRLYN